jgi:hypothetical protein
LPRCARSWRRRSGRRSRKCGPRSRGCSVRRRIEFRRRLLEIVCCVLHSLLNCWSWRRRHSAAAVAAFTRTLWLSKPPPLQVAGSACTCAARKLSRIVQSKTRSVANSFSTPTPKGNSVVFPLQNRSCAQRLASSSSPRDPLACRAPPLPVTVAVWQAAQPHKRLLLQCCSLLQRAAAIAGASAPCRRAAPHPAPSSRPWTAGGVAVLESSMTLQVFGFKNDACDSPACSSIAARSRTPRGAFRPESRVSGNESGLRL